MIFTVVQIDWYEFSRISSTFKNQQLLISPLTYSIKLFGNHKPISIFTVFCNAWCTVHSILSEPKDYMLQAV